MLPSAELTIVLPFYNEEKVIPYVLKRLLEFISVLKFKTEIIAVNDGSTDRTGDLLDEAARNNCDFKVVHLSRNFGHQVALTAGLDFAEGARVAVMDGDLQDPPEVLEQMIRELDSGYDIVLACRRKRNGETVFKLLTARLFYWLMRKLTSGQLPENVGDFRLMNRKSLVALRQMRETHRFLRGMVSWIGFKQQIIEYDRDERVGGATKYSLLKMLSLAWNAVSSFSALPLYVISVAGLVIFLFGIGYSIYTTYMAFILKVTVQGWASLAILQCLFSGLLMLSIGIVGLYVGKIFEEAKGRPLYFVHSTRNIQEQ